MDVFEGLSRNATIKLLSKDKAFLMANRDIMPKILMKKGI